MWIFLNDSFLSIVQPTREDLRSFNVRTPDALVVRARRREDIERVFPKAKIHKRAHRDYQWRAFVARDKVADIIREEVEGIGYDNFKGSVREKHRATVYSRVWGTMSGFAVAEPAFTRYYDEEEIDDLA